MKPSVLLMGGLEGVDTSRYRGEWVAIAKDKVIAHGKDLRLIEQQIMECKGIVTIAKVPKADIGLY